MQLSQLFSGALLTIIRLSACGVFTSYRDQGMGGEGK